MLSDRMGRTLKRSFRQLLDLLVGISYALFFLQLTEHRLIDSSALTAFAAGWLGVAFQRNLLNAPKRDQRDG